MFVVIGLIGIALLLLTICFDDFLDAVMPDLGWLSGPVLADGEVPPPPPPQPASVDARV